MSRRASIIYLCLAPILLVLSWYISHRMYTDYLLNARGDIHYTGKERSWTYAIGFTTLYLVFFFIIRDLYKKKKTQE